MTWSTFAYQSMNCSSSVAFIFTAVKPRFFVLALTTLYHRDGLRRSTSRCGSGFRTFPPSGSMHRLSERLTLDVLQRLIDARDRAHENRATTVDKPPRYMIVHRSSMFAGSLPMSRSESSSTAAATVAALPSMIGSPPTDDPPHRLSILRNSHLGGTINVVIDVIFIVLAFRLV